MFPFDGLPLCVIGSTAETDGLIQKILFAGLIFSPGIRHPESLSGLVRGDGEFVRGARSERIAASPSRRRKEPQRFSIA